jgi:hypothetical protein
MKTRTASFLMALCLANTLVFADSPTDSSLAATTPYADAQQANSAESTREPRNKNKKGNCPQQTAKTEPRSDQPKVPAKTEARSQREKSATL